MKSLKVAHVCEVFSGLSETFLYDYILGTNKSNSCSVYTFTRQNADSRPFERVITLNIPPKWHPQRIIEKARTIIRGPTHDLYFAWPYFKKQLLREFENSPPDIIHAHFGPTGIFSSEIASALDIPLIVTFYGYDCSVLFRKSEWLTRYQRMFDTAKIITVLSENMKEKVARAGCVESKIKVVHLAKNISDYTFRNRKAPIKNFLSVGRLVEKKGIEDAIRAVAIVARNGLAINLKVIGGGPLMNRLKDVATELNANNFVQFLGPLPHDQVKKQFQESDAFILCSKTAADGDEEGTPTVLMEAQSFGLPCISTLHAGISEVIPEVGQQFLAREGDIQDIAKRITLLNQLSDPEVTNLCISGRKKVEDEFNLVTECQKLNDLYQAACKI